MARKKKKKSSTRALTIPLPRSQITVIGEKLVHYALTPYRVLRMVVFVAGVLTLTTFGGVGAGVYYFFSTMPQVEQMDFNKLKSIATKRVQEQLSGKNVRFRWQAINQIHRDLLFSIVMSEDAQFFEHDGINYEALLSALAKNVKKKEFVTGASTITQQVVKNLFFTKEKSLVRKVREYFLARSLEKRFSKNQILELYLNVAEFGPDIYGVYAAARHYFRKSPQSINAGEGAFLALMLPSPRRNYHAMYVKKNFSSSKRAKMKRILQGMLYKEYISQEEYRKYLRTPKIVSH